MFGYTVPQYNRMSPSDLSTYSRYYCEGCHHLRSEYGILSTSAVNYDMTFNTILLNSFTQDTPHFEGARSSMLCILRKPWANSEIFRKMAAYTILLTKWELIDDSCDNPSMKSNAAGLILNRAIMKAERSYPEFDDVVGKGFEELRNMERSGCRDALYMGRTFGRSLSSALAGITEDETGKELSDVFTHLCASVYLLDAIDDLDHDYMDDTYNPLIGDRGLYFNKERFIEENLYELSDTMNKTIGSLQSSYSEIRDRLGFDIGVLDNIVYRGIPDSAKGVLVGASHAKATVKNIFNGHKKRRSSY